MKKFLSLILFLSSVATCMAQENTDYLYATDLQFDEEEESEYFDVNLCGSNIYYTGYGVDIKLPLGLECLVEDGDPLVVMLDADYIDDVIYPKKSRKYTHSVTPTFPTKDDPTHIRVGCMSNASQDLLETKGALFRVYVKNNNEVNNWPIGEIKLYDQQLVQNIEGQIQPKTHFVKDSNHIVLLHTGDTSLPFNVSAANHWSTCILPFAAAVPEGVKAYTVSSYDAANLKLTESKTIEAYTPYILYSESGYSGTLSGTVDASGYPEKGYTDGSVLKGAIVAQTVKNGYVMQKQNGKVMFYKIAEGDSFSVPAGKCWLELPEGNAKSLSFTFEDETGIDNVRPAVKTSDIYLIDGRRVSEPQPGKLYIKGGAKYVKH